MILIGTSGSTKCDWQLIDDQKKILNMTSKGINPFFHSKEVIAQHILEIEDLRPHIEDIDVVFFYGAGCSSMELKAVVNRGLASVFKRSNLYINHDIVAAAFAAYEGVPSLTALIGTGSNSCFFDGDIVRQEITGVDFILGDEGSGSYLGKKLLRDYMYNSLDQRIKQELEDTYSLSRHTVLENVYMKPYANIYLASFASFIEKHQDKPYFYEMVKEGLESYLELYILPFQKHDKFKTHFVGSIPFHFEKILKEVVEEKGIQMGSVIKEPIERLVEYHIKKYYIMRHEESNHRY